MYSLYASALNETEKLWKRKRTKVFLLITLIVPAVSVILLGGLAGSGLPMLMLNLFTFSVFPLFLFMSAVESFSGEEASGTLKLVLVRPITRTKVFASKVLALVFYIAVLLGLLWIASMLLGAVVSGGSLTEGMSDSMKAYAAAFVPMIAVGLIAALVAQCIRSTTGAIGLLVIMYAAAKLLPVVYPQASVWSVFSYTNWHVLWVGTGAAANRLLNAFVILLSYCIMAYTAGSMLFERKQL
ncbi:ABC transporter permease [Paenibacillus alkalitolerans]|uniref:ABC transporter permease n=1 Tax=Paenibacillus alkalitolerans TaxID=2799335 RepID=UPI0018F669D9|nr:ABC transporter permease [Paenibacillus alkalitolerans]